MTPETGLIVDLSFDLANVVTLIAVLAGIASSNRT
jgi:hypothetical protein